MQSPALAATTSVYNVMSFGANGGGKADNTAAFAAAIAAANAAGGGTVYVPAGVYAFSTKLGPQDASVKIRPGAPIELEGQGRNVTSLVEHVANQTLVSLYADGSAVERLTLNSQTFGGGLGVTVKANNTLLEHDIVLGAHKAAVIGGGSRSPFAVYYSGPTGATRKNPKYNLGNHVIDVNISDGVNNDGFSFSFQKNAVITNVVHYGSRLALYADSNVTVTNYKYTPNPICLGATNGFYIGAPSYNVTIKGFVTSGQGGVIGGPVGPAFSQNIAIANETFTSPSGNHLEVGNVNGLTITGANFNKGNYLLVNSPNSASGLVVQNSVIPSIQMAGFNGNYYSFAHMTFNNDQFPSFAENGKAMPTFDELSNHVGATTVAINDGSWYNKAGGFYKGTNTKFTIKDLGGSYRG